MALSGSPADYFRALRVAMRYQSPLAAIGGIAAARLGHGLGPRYFCLFEMYAKPRQAWRNVVADRETSVFLRRLNAEGLPLARDKALFFEHCVRHDIPAAAVRCYVRGRKGRAYDGLTTVDTVEGFARVLDQIDDETLFFKSVNGAHGAGAFVARRHQGAWRTEAHTFSAAELYAHMLDSDDARAGWLVQPVLKPHPGLRDLMPKDVLGTVRILSTYVGDDIELSLPALRIPSGNVVTDNFSEGATGNLVAAIDLETGVLQHAIRSRSSRWPDMVTCDTHPVTGAPIRGRQLPHWEALRRLVLDAHRKTPQMRSVGWDIAIVDGGPVVLEVNTAYGPNLLQVAHQRGVRDVLMRYLPELQRSRLGVSGRPQSCAD